MKDKTSDVRDGSSRREFLGEFGRMSDNVNVPCDVCQVKFRLLQVRRDFEPKGRSNDADPRSLNFL
jgi:hypothetical protein